MLYLRLLSAFSVPLHAFKPPDEWFSSSPSLLLLHIPSLGSGVHPLSPRASFTSSYSLPTFTYLGNLFALWSVSLNHIPTSDRCVTHNKHYPKAPSCVDVFAWLKLCLLKVVTIYSSGACPSTIKNPDVTRLRNL